MRPIVWMIGTSAVTWLAISAFLEQGTSRAVLFGMLGPLLAVTATWVLVERTSRKRPEAQTSIMIMAFALKLLFFGAYVAIMLKALSLQPLPFVISFTIYFIALYITEALLLRRLYRRGMHASR